MRLLFVCLLLLTACQIGPSPLPTPEASPSVVAAASPTDTASPTNTTRPMNTASPTWTPAPTLTSTSFPTATLTPQATLTPLPTTSPTVLPIPDPVVLIDLPVTNQFVPAEISVSGKIGNVKDGSVSIAALTPDGQQVSAERVAAATAVVSDGLSFEAQITLSLPPTPRPALVHVRWEAPDGSRRAEATQQINVLGRFGRVDRLLVEEPLPFNRGVAPTIYVRGVAPGPPAKILVRLLDNADQVLASQEAHFGWYQAGLSCDWGATMPNNPAATQIQVIRLGPDETVLEAVRVRLEPR